MNATALSCEESCTNATPSRREAFFLQGVSPQPHQKLVGALGARGPSQKSRVPAAHAEPRDVRRDVGTILIDDADHPERHPQALHAEPVLKGSLVVDLEQRVASARDRAQRARHRGHPLAIEPQAVASRSRLLIRLEIGLIDTEKLGLSLLKLIRHVGEDGLTRLVGCLGQLRRGALDGGALGPESARCHVCSVMAALAPPEKDEVVAVHDHVLTLRE